MDSRTWFAPAEPLAGRLAGHSDAELVAAWSRDEPGSLAEVYRRFAPALYGTAAGLVGEKAAAGVVHDTLLRAAPRIASLGEPERLRAWLFAILRNETMAGPRSLQPTAPWRAEPSGPAAEAGLGTDPEPGPPPEIAALVWEAVGGLHPRDREVLELHVRGRLDADDLGAVLGVGASHAAALVARTCQRLQRCLGALLLARSGRRDCTELDRLLRGWDGRFEPEARARVIRHTEQCAACSARPVPPLAPALASVVVPAAIPVPEQLQSQLVASMAAGTTPSEPAGRPWAWRVDGFPQPVQEGPGPADGTSTTARSNRGAPGPEPVRTAPPLPRTGDENASRPAAPREVGTAPRVEAVDRAPWTDKAPWIDRAPWIGDRRARLAAEAREAGRSGPQRRTVLTVLAAVGAVLAAGAVAVAVVSSRNGTTSAQPVLATSSGTPGSGNGSQLPSPAGTTDPSDSGTPSADPSPLASLVVIPSPGAVGASPVASSSGRPGVVVPTTRPAPTLPGVLGPPARPPRVVIPRPASSVTAAGRPSTVPAPTAVPSASVSVSVSASPRVSPSPSRTSPSPSATAGFTVTSSTVDLGASGTEATITLVARNGAAVPWSAVIVAGGGLSLSASEGTIPGGGQSTVTVRLDRSAAPAGAIDGTVRISGGDDVERVRVTGTVVRPPTIQSVSANPTRVGLCTGTRSTVTVTYTASSAVTGSVAWSPDGTATRTTPLTGSDGRLTAQVGTFTGLGKRSLTVTITDAQGASATRSTSLDVAFC